METIKTGTHAHKRRGEVTQELSKESSNTWRRSPRYEGENLSLFFTVSCLFPLFPPLRPFRRWRCFDSEDGAHLCDGTEVLRHHETIFGRRSCKQWRSFVHDPRRESHEKAIGPFTIFLARTSLTKKILQLCDTRQHSRLFPIVSSCLVHDA